MFGNPGGLGLGLTQVEIAHFPPLTLLLDDGARNGNKKEVITSLSPCGVQIARDESFLT